MNLAPFCPAIIIMCELKFNQLRDKLNLSQRQSLASRGLTLSFACKTRLLPWSGALQWDSPHSVLFYKATSSAILAGNEQLIDAAAAAAFSP